MCGRASLTKNESELEESFGATFYTEDIERYIPLLPVFNIGPVQKLPFISQDDHRHFQTGLWGWNVPIGGSTQLVINARLEEIDKKKTFTPHIDHRRCIIPLDGYYEWQKSGSQKIPYRIMMPDGGLFAVAGLWREEVANDGSVSKYVVIITRAAQRDILHIHDRMPLILNEEEWHEWLEGNFTEKMKETFSDNERMITLLHYKVSSRVNSIRNNDASLIEPDDSPIYIQKSLFD